MDCKKEDDETLLSCTSRRSIYRLNQYRPRRVVKYFCEEPKAFQKEVNRLKQLTHQNIVLYLGTQEKIESDQRHQYGIIMEHCEHGSLNRIIFAPEYMYSMNTVMWWAVHLFRALCFLKENQFIHSDIRPEKILVARDYSLKLCDFETSQMQSEKSKITFKSDVFSAGVVLWEMIERRRACFTGEGSERQIKQIKVAEQDLRKIVTSSVDSDPEKRPNPLDVLLKAEDIRKEYESYFALEPTMYGLMVNKPNGYEQTCVEYLKEKNQWISRLAYDWPKSDSGYETDHSESGGREEKKEKKKEEENEKKIDR